MEKGNNTLIAVRTACAIAMAALATTAAAQALSVRGAFVQGGAADHDARSLGVGVIGGAAWQRDQSIGRLSLHGEAYVARWGADLPGQPTLGQLVARILKLVPDLPRLRLSSIDAAEIDPDLLKGFEDPRLMPYLHLSLQAGDDMILKRMKRRHLRADALKLIADVRAVRPDVAFGADLIAGFPTETDEMFENTLKLVDEAGLAFLHVFPFSPRPGTPAARMPQLQRPVIKARAARLREAGQAALQRHLAAQVGRTLSGLVEKGGIARAEDFTEIAFSGEAKVGGIVTLRVTGVEAGRLTAELA